MPVPTIIEGHQWTEEELRGLRDQVRQNVQHSADAMRYAMLRGGQWADLRQLPLTPTRREVTLRAKSDLFWSLPVVAYLVEKIPAAKVVISPDGLVATYLLQAKEHGYSLKRQCADLGIPWSARLLAANEVCLDAVKVAKILKPSVFSQCKPEYDHYYDWGVKQWATAILWLFERGAATNVLNWYARHAMQMGEDDRDYLLTLTGIAASTAPETVRRRSEKWHREQVLACVAGEFGFKPGDRVKTPFDMRSYSIGRLKFVALTTIEDFIEDGSKQKHCIATRFQNAFRRSHCYFSIRDADKRVATVEYALPGGEMTEIRAFANARPHKVVVDTANEFSRILRGGPGATDQRVEKTAGPLRLPLINRNWFA